MAIFKSKVVLILLIAGFGWQALSLIKIKLQESIVNKEARELEVKIHNLEASNSLLEKTIGYFKNPLFLEREARLRFNYKAPGEEVVFVYPDTNEGSVSGSADFGRQLANMPNYLKWFYYILGF